MDRGCSQVSRQPPEALAECLRFARGRAGARQREVRAPVPGAGHTHPAPELPAFRGSSPRAADIQVLQANTRHFLREIQPLSGEKKPNQTHRPSPEFLQAEKGAYVH